MEFEAMKSNLYERFSKIFRPPGWKISNQAINAFIDKGFTLHLHKDIPYDLTDVQNTNKIYYCDYMPPEIPLNNSDKKFFHIVFHACEWLKNFLSVESCELVMNFFKNKNLAFRFLE